MGFFTKLFKSTNRKVVVVEDDVPLRHFIADRLLENGLDVVETGDGATALDLILKHKPDCIVLDVMLPGKNGMQILAELRAVDENTPVIVLTTLSGEGGLKIEASKHHAVFLNKADSSLEVVIETIMRYATKD